MFLALLLAPIAGALPPAIPDTDAHATWYGEYAGDYAGRTISGNADTDGDGYPDLLVGAYGSDDGGTSSGEAYLLLGGATRWSGSLGLASADASFDGEAAGDYAGRNVAATGDVDGDGLSDMLIGAYCADTPGGTDAGEAYLVLGKRSGWSLDTPPRPGRGRQLPG